MAKTISKKSFGRINLRYFKSAKTNKYYLAITQGDKTIFLSLPEIYQFFEFLRELPLKINGNLFEQRLTNLEKRVEELEKIVKNK